MVNLRPRTPKFDPFRSIRPAGGGGGDTYSQPDLDTSEVNRSLSLLRSVEGLAPSLNRFLDQAQRTFLAQTGAEADALVADMTPEQIRAESVAEWEAHSKKSKIDNAWWTIMLDEAAGERLGLEFDERLTGRLQDATDPTNPNAHLTVLQEERARATEGLGFYARASFEQAAKPVMARFVTRAAEEREARVQAHLGDSFKGTVRGIVKQALDPALGGSVDLGGLMKAVQDEYQRSGNDGRAEVLGAVDDALGIRIAQADTPEQLDAVRVQAEALLADLSGQAFGVDSKTLEESNGLELDALQESSERSLEARERQLRDRGNDDEREANEDISDAAFGFAAKIFQREMTPEAANEALAAEADRIAGEYGVDRAALFGRGLVTLRTQSVTLDGTRYAGADNPETVLALEDFMGGPDYTRESFADMLAGAAERGELTARTHGALLRQGGDERARQIEGESAARVNAAMAPLGGRLISVQAAPFLDQITDANERDRVEGWMAAEMTRASVAERSRLSALIQQRGPDRLQEAVDEWAAGFAERSPAMLSEIAARARERFAGEVHADPEEAWTRAVRSSRDYGPAEQRFLYDWIQEQYAGREKEAEAILSELHGRAVGEIGFENPVGDLAAMVAREGDRLLTAEALDLYRSGSSAFLDTLREGQDFGAQDFDVRRATGATEARMRWLRVEAPKPKPPSSASREQAAAAGTEAKGATVAAAGEKAQAAASANERMVQAQARAQELREGGFPGTIQAEADREAEKAAREADRRRAIAFSEHHRVVGRVAAGLRPDIGKPVLGGLTTRRPYDPIANRNAAGEALEIRNGRLHLAQPPTKTRKTYLGFGPIVRSVDLERYEELVTEIEGQFVAAKSYLGLTLPEVRAGKAMPFEGATEDKWINLDRGLISPVSTPFFGSIAELDAADDALIGEWIALFPAYSREMFVAAQRQVILERIPETQPPK